MNNTTADDRLLNIINKISALRSLRKRTDIARPNEMRIKKYLSQSPLTAFGTAVVCLVWRLRRQDENSEGS